MKIRIVICTHNRAELLSNTLESLNRVNRPDHMDFAILVIANACTDNTRQLLVDYQDNAVNDDSLPLKWAEEEALGKSNALNLALSIITDGILCFIDDDHRIDANYFDAVIHAAQSYPEMSLFCGKVIPDWTGKEPNWAHDNSEYRIHPLPIPHFELGDKPHLVSMDSRIPGGGNLFAQRELFDRVGGFNAHLGPQGHNLLGGEDSDFVLRALRAGEKLQYIPEMVQYHFVDPNRLTLSYIIRKSFQRSRSITLAKLTRKTQIPIYMWRKLINYFVALILSFNTQKARFYIVRIASVLGEIKAFRESARLTG